MVKKQQAANLEILENILPMFWLNAPVVIRSKVITTGAFSRNIGKLFSELKLATDNPLFIYAEAKWEATESCLWTAESIYKNNQALCPTFVWRPPYFNIRYGIK